MVIKNRSYANRGMLLERIIDMANNNYRNAGVADVRKVPAPVKIMNVKGKTITGHLERPTWVDYSGVYQGTSIIFDAKETSKTSFPMDNLSEHQYRLLESWAEKGAIAFLIVYFSKFDKYYFLPFSVLQWAYNRAATGERKSIAHEEFETMGQEITSKDGYTLHYLEAVKNFSSKKTYEFEYRRLMEGLKFLREHVEDNKAWSYIDNLIFENKEKSL